MRNVLFLMMSCLLPGTAHAQQTDWEAVMKNGEAAWDWQPGDLIFRNGLDDFDEMIRLAEGGEWASVGIMRAASGDPRVVFVDRDEGVTERMLYEYVEGLDPQDYAVYRIEALPSPVAGSQMQMGPIASYALLTAYGHGHDSALIPGNNLWYNAELPFDAAGSIGITLGLPLLLRDLAAQHPPLRDALLENRRAYRFCEGPVPVDECWETMGSMSIVTPGTLIKSGQLRKVWPQ
ncbi:MAG: peptidoglycan peptidase [Paracoccus denitrificans]|uniref:Peptidoglycan peptidase n=1 Tax=Paracoccus denitrificans TaxID=266 RepID=A0A533IAU5_PARDE|nr:MAG: peptidoglycan peptidase [Paracoccus denitrificans]